MREAEQKVAFHTNQWLFRLKNKVKRRLDELQEKLLLPQNSIALAPKEGTGADFLCPFIENKEIDFDLVAELLELSKSCNRWANFGPVHELLTVTLEQAMGVHKDKAIVICKSATDALFLTTNIKSIGSGRKMRWVVSSFGFFSTHINSLSDSIVVDCDSKGMMELKALQALPIDSWDGIIVTNIFGLCDDMSEYMQVCKRQGKAIVIDSALGFTHQARSNANYPDEIVSFHQTKPWGVGEGGCAIVDRSQVELARSLINFGVGTSPHHRPFSTNSKVADFCCALIMQRILTIPEWSTVYEEQAQRVRDLVLDEGLTLLPGISDNKIMGHIPVVAPKPVRLDMLQTKYICFGKYYRPLSDDTPNASQLYQHMLNIPCHKQLEILTDKQLRSAIREVIGG